jgi:hypothetical protein
MDPSDSPWKLRNTFGSWEIRAVDESFMVNWGGTRKLDPHMSHQGILSSIDSGDLKSGRLYDYSAEATVLYSMARSGSSSEP